MRCHRLIAIVLVVAAGAFAADPTILRRHVPDVPPQPENLTVGAKGASDRPVFGVGDSQAKQLKGIARYGELTVATRSPLIVTTASGRRSTTNTGQRSISSMGKDEFVITTSWRANTASPSASSRSFWSKTEPLAWLGAPSAYPLTESRQHLATMCNLPKPISAIVTPSVSHHPSDWLKTHERTTAHPRAPL